MELQKTKELVSKVVGENMSKGNLAYSTVVKHKKKNGQVINVELDVLAIELPSGLHFIVSGHDLTERITLQHKVVEEKVAAQKEIARTIIQTQEKERSDISKELHDNINQILTSAKLCIENTKYFPEHRNIFTEKSITTIQNAIQEVRTLSKDKSIVMRVQDNGTGFDCSLKRSGLGLINIRNRVELFKRKTRHTNS